MKFIFIILCYLQLQSVALAQSIVNDSITLNEVTVKNKILKKPKIKNINCGTDSKYLNSKLYFTDASIYYLIHNIPLGTLQEITITFSEICKNPPIGHRDYKTFKINKTEFELNIYEALDNDSIGSKINPDPISIVIPETRKDDLIKINLSISDLKLETDKFYIQLKRTTDIGNPDLYFYALLLYRTDDRAIHKTADTEIGEIDRWFNAGLKINLKTLTSEY